MLKKIIAAVLSVLTALCLALPAFAVRNINDTDSTYESTTAGAGLRESELEKYTITIDGPRIATSCSLRTKKEKSIMSKAAYRRVSNRS